MDVPLILLAPGRIAGPLPSSPLSSDRPPVHPRLDALAVLPEIFLPAAEKELDTLREAVVRLSSAVIAILDLAPSVPAFEAHFLGILRAGPGRELQALSPGTYQNVHNSTVI